MAKAIAECTCTVCGKHFTRFRWCNNRREADSWEEWASTYFDKCPSCLSADQQRDTYPHYAA